MKVICFEPRLYKDWANGYTSEERWRVIQSHWGIIDTKFYKQIKQFEGLFTNEPKPTADEYIKSVVRVDCPISKETLNYAMLLYRDDIIAWELLREDTGNFYNTVTEFVAKKPFRDKWIRCACFMGRDTVKTVSLKWFVKMQWLKLKCKVLNYKLKQHYKMHPFVNYHKHKDWLGVPKGTL